METSGKVLANPTIQGLELEIGALSARALTHRATSPTIGFVRNLTSVMTFLFVLCN